MPKPPSIHHFISLAIVLIAPIRAGAQVSVPGSIIQRPSPKVEITNPGLIWASDLPSADSAAIYRMVLSAGLDTILGDSLPVLRLLYLGAGLPAYLDDSVTAWTPRSVIPRSCRVARQRGCPKTTPRSLDLDALRVITNDSVEVPFAVDAHRKIAGVGAGPPPTWLVLRAWEMGMFPDVGGPVGGCSGVPDNGRHLIVIRQGAGWRVLGIGHSEVQVLELCA